MNSNIGLQFSFTELIWCRHPLPRPSKPNRNYHPATKVDDNMYGLTSEQSEMRRAVSKFAQEELAPHAERIDKDDKFDDLRNFWKKNGKSWTSWNYCSEEIRGGWTTVPPGMHFNPVLFGETTHGPQGRQNISRVPAIHRPISESVEQDEREDLRWVQV